MQCAFIEYFSLFKQIVITPFILIRPGTRINHVLFLLKKGVDTRELKTEMKGIYHNHGKMFRALLKAYTAEK